MYTLISHRYIGRNLKKNLRSLTTTAGSFGNKKSDDDIEIPPEPTTCCMSGCANCVWIAYAEELMKLHQGNGEKAREIILDKITDPNLKMFLSIELKYIPCSNNDKVDK